MRWPEETLAEDEETVTVRNCDGFVERRWKNKSAVPQRFDPLIKTPDDWRRYRERLAPSPDRLPADYAQLWQRSRAEDFFLAFSPTEPIWWVLMTLGFEHGLEFLADHPDAVAEMVSYQARLSLALLDLAMAVGKPDGFWYFADLCYKNGMLFSPRFFREIVLPAHQQVTAACWERGVVPMFHCDGDVRAFIPLLIEGGFACVQPLEARAGNDVRQLKPLYGDRIALFGNISVERLSRTPEEAEEEVASKLSVAAPGGRYLFHSDHSLPPTVPLANYQRALAVARQIGSYG
jgi:uroporphyrinogen decarboxylase